MPFGLPTVDARRIPLPKTGHEPPPRGGVILAAVGDAAVAESVLLEANSESDDVGWLLGEERPARLLARERGLDLEERGDLEAAKPDDGEVGPACAFWSPAVEVDGKVSEECSLTSRLIWTAENLLC